jgi:hypothetical protein
LIELLSRDGQVTRTVDVWRWPLTLGRVMDNDVVVDDPDLAAQHLRLAADETGRPAARAALAQRRAGHGPAGRPPGRGRASGL